MLRYFDQIFKILLALNYWSLPALLTFPSIENFSADAKRTTKEKGLVSSLISCSWLCEMRIRDFRIMSPTSMASQEQMSWTKHFLLCEFGIHKGCRLSFSSLSLSQWPQWQWWKGCMEGSCDITWPGLLEVGERSEKATQKTWRVQAFSHLYEWSSGSERYPNM